MDRHRWDRQEGQQISWNRQDTSILRMPPVCAVTGAPADTAIVLRIGTADLILPVCDQIRVDHLRPFGALHTAWRIRPSMHADVITIGNAANGFVEQLLKINERGSVYVGGLYPLKATRTLPIFAKKAA